MKPNQSFLTPTEFHILLALRGESLHGYQIIKQVEQDTEQGLKLLTGTLYNALKRLIADDLLQEVEKTESEQGDARRKYYALTEKGKKTLGLELKRYELSTRLAQSGQFVTAM